MLATVRYWSEEGFAAVKLPCIDTSEIVPKTIDVGCAVGELQGVEGTEVTVKLSMLIFGLYPVVPPVPL